METGTEFLLVGAQFEQLEKFFLAANAILVPKVIDLRNRFEQGRDLIFLLRGQISSPIFDVFQIPLQARTLAVSERAVQFVFFCELPVVLAPSFLQRNEL